MKFAYNLTLQGEFLAIDDNGQVKGRLPVTGDVGLEPDALANLSNGLMQAKDQFCTQNNILSVVSGGAEQIALEDVKITKRKR